MTNCVVFICNKAYFDKFINTCNQLVTVGKYTGDICLVIGNDLQNDELLECDTIKNNKVIVKHFPDIQFSDKFWFFQKAMKRNPYLLEKKFQYHKLHLFNTFFKQWDYIFYLDCGIHIMSDISPMISEAAENTLLAHSDAYPTYNWKLECQFYKQFKQVFTKFSEKYNLNIDYFQTTIMLYSTKIIEDNTFNDLIQLLEEYPISITNEQGMMGMYFTNIKPVFKQIKTHNDDTYFYDYLSRNPSYKYIMLKSP